MKQTRIVPCLVEVNLDRLGNSVFSMVHSFRDQARKQSWKESLISRVINDALEGDHKTSKEILNQYCRKEEEHEYC